MVHLPDRAPGRHGRRSSVRHEDLRDVVADYLVTSPEQDVDVRLVVVDGETSVVVTEHERVLREPLRVLARKLSATTPAPSGATLPAAFARWVASRPVSDEAAATRGIATLAWSSPDRGGAHGAGDVGAAGGVHALRWRVVVPRPSRPALEWFPLASTGRDRVEDIRREALRRADELVVTPRRAGSAVVWTCASDPALSSAVVRRPVLLQQHLPGVAAARLRAVAAPGRPVAVADVAAATRLSEESLDAHVLAPLAAFDQVVWRVGGR